LLEHLLESSLVDVEGDLVGIFGRSSAGRLEEDEQRLPDADRAVLAVELLAARQLEIETVKTIRAGRSEGEVVHAEHAHASRLYGPDDSTTSSTLSITSETWSSRMCGYSGSVIRRRLTSSVTGSRRACPAYSVNVWIGG